MSSFELQIPVPCHENWNQMLPHEQGRFCLSCQKSVVDFSAMTDQEIVSYFKNAKENTCGRFRDDQLSRNYKIDQKKKLNWYKYFFKILIPTLLFTSRGYSQGLIGPLHKVCASPITKGETKPIILGQLNDILLRNSLSGVITDDKGQPLAGASIMIKGTKDGVASDAEGKFSLRISKAGQVTLMTSYVGYESLEMTIETDKLYSPVNVILKPALMDEVVVIGYGTSKGHYTLTGAVSQIQKSQIQKQTIFHDFTQKIAGTFKTAVGLSSMKIYPNPLRRSAYLTMEAAIKNSGNHRIEIFDMNGRLIQAEQFEVNANNLQKQIRLNQTIAAGVYLVHLSGPNGEKISSQKLIVE